MFTIGDVIRKLREKKDWSLDDMARESGVNRQSISEIERGIVDPRQSTLTRLVNALGFPDIASLESFRKSGELSDDLPRHTGTGQPPLDEAEDYDRDITRGYVKGGVPLVGDAEASTDGLIVWDSEGLVSGQITEWVARAFSNGDPHAYALRVRGGSMEPRYAPGEVVVAQPRERVHDGDYAVVVLTTGERLIKQVFRSPDGWILHSLNPLYQDRPVKNDDVALLHPIRHSIARR